MQYYFDFDVMACFINSKDYQHSKWLSNYGDKYKISFKIKILSILKLPVALLSGKSNLKSIADIKAVSSTWTRKGWPNTVIVIMQATDYDAIICLQTSIRKVSVKCYPLTTKWRLAQLTSANRTLLNFSWIHIHKACQILKEYITSVSLSVFVFYSLSSIYDCFLIISTLSSPVLSGFPTYISKSPITFLCQTL